MDQFIEGAAALVASHIFRTIAILCNQRNAAAVEAVLGIIDSCNGNVKAYILQYLQAACEIGDDDDGLDDDELDANECMLFYLLAAEDAEDEGCELLDDAIDDLVAQARQLSGAVSGPLDVGSVGQGFITALHNEIVTEQAIA